MHEDTGRKDDDALEQEGHDETAQAQTDPVVRLSLWAMATGLLGVLVLPIAPAITLGVMAITRARRQKKDIPVPAVLGLAAAGGWLMVAVILGAAFLPRWLEIKLDEIDEATRAETREQARQEFEARRRVTTLDKGTACELLKRHIQEHGFLSERGEEVSELHCDGALEVSDRTATLRKVRTPFLEKELVLTGCFFRGPRWLVLQVTRGECKAPPADMPPIPPADAMKAPDGGKDPVEEFENKLYWGHRWHVQQAAIEEVDKRFRAVLAAGKELGKLEERPCDAGTLDQILGHSGMRSVEYADYSLLDELLNQKVPALELRYRKQWNFLTSERIREALVGDGDALRRANHELVEVAAPLLVVHQHEQRSWARGTIARPGAQKEVAAKARPHADEPRPSDQRLTRDQAREMLVSEGPPWFGASYKGVIALHRTDTGERLCQLPLSFENTELVVNALEAYFANSPTREKFVNEDLEKLYKPLADQAVARFSPRLRLGYGEMLLAE